MRNFMPWRLIALLAVSFVGFGWVCLQLALQPALEQAQHLQQQSEIARRVSDQHVEALQKRLNQLETQVDKFQHLPTVVPPVVAPWALHGGPGPHPPHPPWQQHGPGGPPHPPWQQNWPGGPHRPRPPWDQHGPGAPHRPPWDQHGPGAPHRPPWEQHGPGGPHRPPGAPHRPQKPSDAGHHDTGVPHGPPAGLTTSSDAELRALATEDAIALVVITCHRVHYLKRAMDSVLKAERNASKFPIVISQDGDFPEMTSSVETAYVKTAVAFHIRHPHEPSAQSIAKKFGGGKQALGYVRIAQHFGFAMKKVFEDAGFNSAIFLEEDLEVAPDFFSYFGAMNQLLRNDERLFCVSAWNDNGQGPLVKDPTAAFRTDFFPGLGWMMTKSLWGEVKDRWAEAYWDEFMRRPDVRHGRHCIRPEISRTYTFGEEEGTSEGQFSEHLKNIQLNTENVKWPEQEAMTYLRSQADFNEYLKTQIGGAVETSVTEVDARAASGDYKRLRILYEDVHYQQIARHFKLMPDEKEGIRRMSYRGIIAFSWKGTRVYLYTNKFPELLQ
eukprot:TRINITY_DN1528_c0_g1_i1.p1 TRINITY_DN1528_c0_g1~~TRINITY_DN1528_c0_g1_i1.p1  ORF type:complete len:554 (-),score=91.22 TRINITY_DN1528_c0_g1_i1:107-1768(-)